MTKPCVVFDLETTGLKYYRHEIIEFAAVKLTPDNRIHQYLHGLVKPSAYIPAAITQLTGITDDMVESDGIELGEAMSLLFDFIEDHPVISYNLDFDLPFLTAAFERCGIKARKNLNSCALKLARKAWPGLPNYRLGTVAGALGLDGRNEHRALGDATRAAHVYVRSRLLLG